MDFVRKMSKIDDQAKSFVNRIKAKDGKSWGLHSGDHVDILYDNYYLARGGGYNNTKAQDFALRVLQDYIEHGNTVSDKIEKEAHQLMKKLENGLPKHKEETTAYTIEQKLKRLKKRRDPNIENGIIAMPSLNDGPVPIKYLPPAKAKDGFKPVLPHRPLQNVDWYAGLYRIVDGKRKLRYFKTAGPFETKEKADINGRKIVRESASPIGYDVVNVNKGVKPDKALMENIARLQVIAKLQAMVA